MIIGRRAAVMLLVAGLAVLPLVASTPGAVDKALDDLMFELQLIPLEGQAPAAFELERLGDGKTVTLAEHRGRPVMLYFWATW